MSLFVTHKGLLVYTQEQFSVIKQWFFQSFSNVAFVFPFRRHRSSLYLPPHTTIRTTLIERFSSSVLNRRFHYSYLLIKTGIRAPWRSHKEFLSQTKETLPTGFTPLFVSLDRPEIWSCHPVSHICLFKAHRWLISSHIINANVMNKMITAVCVSKNKDLFSPSFVKYREA